MKLYFMKKEAMEKILKSNLDIIYMKYFTESDNKWLWQVCDGDPFVEYKEVPDFKLTSLDSEISIGEVEFNNCKILYQNLAFLNESQASDERLWAGLCHSVFYDYIRKRWGYDKKQPKTAKEAVSNIKSRFFFSGGTRAGLYRNTLAKCWWVGHNTYDSNNPNPFVHLDIIGSNDISSKISDIFYSNTFSSNPIILKGIVKSIKYFRDEGTQLNLREHIRPSLQLLNAIGGGVILDCLSEDEISEIMIDSIYAIIQGDEQAVETDGEIDELHDAEISNEYIEEQKENATYVAIGHRVKVREEGTGDIKIIAVDYLRDTTTIPSLARMILGKRIGEFIEFQSKSYQIEEIQ